MPDSGRRFNVGGGSPWSPQEAVRSLMDKFYELTQMMSRAMSSIHNFGNMLTNLIGDMGRLKALIAVSVVAGGRMPARLLSSSLHHAAVGSLGGHSRRSSKGGIEGGGDDEGEERRTDWVKKGKSKLDEYYGHKLEWIKKINSAMEEATSNASKSGGKAGAKTGAAATGQTKESIEKEIVEATATIEAYGANSPKGKVASQKLNNARARLTSLEEPFVGPPSVSPGLAMAAGMSSVAVDVMAAGMSGSGRGNVVEQGGKSRWDRLKGAIGGVGGAVSMGARALGSVAGGVAGPVLAAGAVAHGLMSAASPDLSATLNMQFQILAGTIGTHLIPTFMKLGMVMQRATSFAEKHGGAIDTVVGLNDRFNPIHSTFRGADALGKKLGLWDDDKGDPSNLLMTIRSMRAQPRYSSIEEAYKGTQIAALSQDPLEAKLQRLVTDNLIKMLESMAEANGLQKEVKDSIDRQGIR